ncbi:MAG: YceI family protein [Flavobacteriaceae bacterium]|nr:YceI family protein [Flavobacteriaceae bacterium]
MKKTILSIMIVGAMMISCNNNGKKAETKDAVNVEVIKTNKTITFKTVKDGSLVNWRASHLGGVQPRFGKIYFKEASFLVNNGLLTNANIAMNMSTLTVENFPEGAEEKGKLTGHLQSPDFFNIEKYPTSKFELTNLKETTGTYNSKVTGNLIILDVTKSITFNANVKVSENEVSIKSEDFSINRTDWGLSYNTKGTAGVSVDYLIANDIGFTINLTLKK